MVRKELKWYLALCMALLLLASCGRSGTGDETTGTSGPAYSSSEEASSEEERTDPSVTESSDAGSTPADPSVPSASAEDSLSDYPVEGMGFSISLPEGYRLLRISGAYRDGTGKPVLLDYVDEYVAVSGEITPQELADQLEDCPEDPSRGSGAYRVPDCVVRWAMKQIAGKRMGYRSAAGKASRRLREYGLPGISFSELNKRKNRLRIHDGTTDVTDARVMAFGTGACPRSVPITVAIDSTGLSPDRPSGWRVYHWNQKSVRGWYKLHAAVDTETSEILAYVITEPYVHDSLMFTRLVEAVIGAGHKVACVLADAAYDKKEYWNWMERRNIEFVPDLATRSN